jgi:putative transposase
LNYSTNERLALLEPEHPKLSLRQQCMLLNINRSSYYYQPQPIDVETLKLMRIVDEIYTEYPFFGSRKMVDYLKLHGYGNFGRAKIRTIYQQLGLKAACPGPHTSSPHPQHKIYPYLLRNVKIEHCDHVWSSDITYIRLRKGFVYLVAIIDWFSRFVLDWELNISLDADFCIETLSRALQIGKCDIFNTDQGSQFTSAGFTELLQAKGIKISMDGKGRALDNVFVERLWRSVKYECIYLCEIETVKEAYKLLTQYFNFYNNKRPHQSLNGQPPATIYLCNK